MAELPQSPERIVEQLVRALHGVLARVAEPDRVLAVLLQQAVSVSGATRGVLAEVSPSGELRFSVLHSYRRDLLADAGHYSRGVFARCLATGEDVVMRNACADLPAESRRTAAEFHMAAVLCMPMRVGDRIGALLHLEHSQIGHFDESHVRLLRPLLDLATPVLEALTAGRAVLQERDRLAESASRLQEEAEQSRTLLARDWSFGRFVGRCPAVRELEDRLRQAAAAPYPVLITGETGTGKSVLARILHFASPRARQAFVTVFCPSLERTMVEPELFGHRRGAFTGAVADRAGKVQAAEGGTLFLDEIADLPVEIQPKLLRLLQERTYEPVGDAVERRADVRVVTATNRDLEEEIRNGRFRRDLFERLNFVPVRIPPLRERREDIPAIFRHCLDQTGPGRWIELEEEATAYLRDLDFSWPGNVRHLEQLAARLTLDPPRGRGAPADLRRALGWGASGGPARRGDEEATGTPGVTPMPGAEADELEAGLPQLLAEAERSWLEAALRRYPGATRAELAARLKIGESSLYRKLQKYALADRA